MAFKQLGYIRQLGTNAALPSGQSEHVAIAALVVPVGKTWVVKEAKIIGARTAFVATVFGQLYILKTGGTDLLTTNNQGQTESAVAVNADVLYLGAEVDYNAAASQQLLSRATILSAGDAIRLRIMNRAAGAINATTVGMRAIISGDER